MAANKLTLELDASDTQMILEKYVKPVMQKILLEHIQSDIYGAYTPKEYAWIGGQTYHRRGSLLSPLAIYSTIDGNTISMTSNAEPESLWGGSVSGDGAFLGILESGDMGAWSRVTGRTLPRPAISNAQAEVNKSQEIMNAVIKGFQEVFNSRNI